MEALAVDRIADHQARSCVNVRKDSLVSIVSLAIRARRTRARTTVNACLRDLRSCVNARLDSQDNGSLYFQFNIYLKIRYLYEN